MTLASIGTDIEGIAILIAFIVVVPGGIILLLRGMVTSSTTSHRAKQSRQAARRSIDAAIECPTCKTVGYVDTISGGQKAKQGLKWGVFAIGFANKTFHCGRCGANW